MEIVKLKCSYTDKYKATRKPTCGCKVCFDKWEKQKKEDWDRKEWERLKKKFGDK